jgi:hypothetical protein
MTLLIEGVVIVLLVGLAIKLVLDRAWLDDWISDLSGTPGIKRITWWEFLAGALICSVLVVPFAVKIGNQWALNNQLTYHEYWNGYETAAVRSETECHRDGACEFTYRCDPYEVTEVVTVPNADGKGSHTEIRTHTEYHSCPEATVEWDFAVRTTLGDYHIERTFPDNPTPFRGDSVRGDVRHGTPPFWQAAADRIGHGDPGPVTVRKDYKNYILASQSTILHKFSGDIDQYRPVMPAPSSGIRDFYYADKAYGIGENLGPEWSAAVSRFNAAFGTDLQGDLHVVVVGPGTTNDPDSFVGALNAYWTGPQFGQNALSKNALVVVLGTDGQTVQWARAFTGMPRGNEALLTDLQRSLQGRRFDARELIGGPVGQVKDGKYTGVAHQHGTIEDAVWGVHQFARVCMTCKQEGGSGFTYLGAEIQPTTAQKLVILSAAVFVSLLVWAAFIIIGTGEPSNDRTGSDRYDRFRR